MPAPGGACRSCYAPLVDVLLSEVLTDCQFKGRPQLCPFIGCELREGDALRHAHLVTIHEDDVVVTGAYPQLLVNAVLGARRVLVEADVATNAKIHAMPRNTSRPYDLDFAALTIAHAIQNSLREFIGGDQSDLAVSAHFGKPELHT